jgi:hypothetical protein
MCTLSWSVAPHDYAVFFNRDERLTRGRGVPPTRHDLGRLAALAPIDPDHGGTWIGVNARGLTLALLNGLEREPPSAESALVSRGLLVLELLEHPDAAAVASALERTALARFRPFGLFAIAPGTPPRLHEWDGARLAVRTLGPGERPLVSSSFRVPGARAARARVLAGQLRAGRTEREALAALHASHEPERGPLSACMHHEEGGTVSSCTIEVSEAEARLRYVDGPPCAPLGTSVHRLPLR